MEKLPFPPEQATYVYGSTKDVVSTELDGGYSRTRRDIVGSASTISVTWNFDLEDYQYFRSFYNSACGRGAYPFLIDLLLDQPYLEEYVAKFVANSVETSEPFGLSRVVSAKLEVIPNEDLEADAITLLLYQLSPSPFFNELSNLSNLDWPPDLVPPLLAQLVNHDIEQSHFDQVILHVYDYGIFGALAELAN
jgi:hypothetical protein